MDFSRLAPLPDYDPRVVALYDGDNPPGFDHAYFQSLVTDDKARSILDLGCGTGLLTVTLAGNGRRVVGVDPSASMVAYARQRPGAEAVTWVTGNVHDAPTGPYDLIVMTGNVAQHIPDPEWGETLSRLGDLAADGAILSFDTRNPAIEAWKTWRQPIPTERQTPFGLLREWYDVVDEGAGVILFRAYNQVVEHDDVFLQEERFTFRDHATIIGQLDVAGFDTVGIWGDWTRTPLDGMSEVMVVEAKRRSRQETVHAS